MRLQNALMLEHGVELGERTTAVVLVEDMGERITQADDGVVTSHHSQRQSLCTVERIIPRWRAFSKALASICGLPSILATSTPALSSCTE